MAGKLKIYACSGIGETGDKRTYDYWLDNTNTVDNTQAVNTLLSLINMRVAELTNLQLSQAEQIALLDEIDLYSVSLYYAQQFSGNGAELQKAGTVIGGLLANGLFHYESVDNAERDTHLDQVFGMVADAMAKGTEAQPTSAFLNWWQATIIERDKRGLNAVQRGIVNKRLKDAVSGVGEIDPAWQQNKDLAQYLTKGSEYFLYLYFTDEQLSKLPRKFRKKAALQQKTYDYCKALFVDVYGSEEEMKNIIYTGIVGYFKATPEQVCEKIVKTGSIGEAITLSAAAIVEIILAVIAAVVTIVKAICQCVKDSNVAKYEAVTAEQIDSSVPNEEDFDGLDIDGLGESSTSYLWIAAAIAGLVLIFKK